MENTKNQVASGMDNSSDSVNYLYPSSLKRCVSLEKGILQMKSKTLFCLIAIIVCNTFSPTTLEASKVKVKHLEYKLKKPNDNKIKEFLINWIEEHSEVSLSTIKEIVNTVLKETNEPLLYVSIFERESRFNPTASSGHCFGLGQISNIHIKELKEAGIISNRKELFHVTKNIKASKYILNKKLSLTKQNIKKALYLYVGDTSRSDYVRHVLANYNYLKSKVKGLA